jgi:hypothetical protein
MEKTVTLNFSHFICKGTAQISLWGGGQGTIQMDSFRISEGYTNDDLRACLNDGGFGCESIDGAVIDIYGVYSNDECQTTRWHETRVIGEVCEELLEEA